MLFLPRMHEKIRPVSSVGIPSPDFSCVPILLPVLKIYSARNVYYRFSVLAVKLVTHDACFPAGLLAF